MKEKATEIFIIALIIFGVLMATLLTSAFLQNGIVKNNQDLAQSSPIPTVTSTPSTNTSSPTPTASPTPTPTSTSTPTPTSSPTPTPVPTTSPTPSPTATPTPSPTPSPSTPSQEDSINWAGYIATFNQQNPQPTVTSVSGSWVVPAVTNSTNDTYSSVWIGIGGQNDSTLIQCGTDQLSINGQVEYLAWYELLPAQSITINNITVSAGDQIDAEIQLVNQTQNQWTINLTDTTANESFQKNVFYNSSQLSAEWIIERPTVDGNLSQLANFGNITFTNCTATIGSVSGAINNFSSSEIIMYSSTQTENSATQLTDVSDLADNGEEFTMTYLAPA